MRLPGGIHDAAAFWDVLLHGKNMTGPVPGDRYNAKSSDNTMGKKKKYQMKKKVFPG